jgi:hypothetical protein
MNLTIKEWINYLPEPYRSQALKYEHISWRSKVASMYTALFVAFSWDRSEEGFEYWDEVADRYYFDD